MAEVAKRLGISGRVQGVAYRAWTVETATSLGLRGWVRNRRDGSVEALIVGPEVSVARMIEACRRGPPAARVDRVEITEAPDAGLGAIGFRQLPST
jgi:acylphosphatase